MKVCNPRHEHPEERQRVVAWRIDRLRDAGFPSRLAAALTRDTRYDVHALLELADRGCPPNLAARILFPLDDDCESGR